MYFKFLQLKKGGFRSTVFYNVMDGVKFELNNRYIISLYTKNDSERDNQPIL